jgi:hypothetical protein
VARGSTLLNITQQIASSIGVAVISVVYTNYLTSKPLAGPAIAAAHDPAIAAQLGPAQISTGLSQAAEAFAQTFLIAAILVALTLIPAAFLPRRHEESHLLDEQDREATAMIH